MHPPRTSEGARRRPSYGLWHPWPFTHHYRSLWISLAFRLLADAATDWRSKPATLPLGCL